jgi:protein regulator of cytokinesis 1
MYDQLDILWRRLGDNRAELDQFVEDHRGTTEEVVCVYEKKLEEMLVRKREEIGTFIKNAREDIVKLWDNLMIGEDERADFAPFVDGNGILSLSRALLTSN